jgi:hypothetical protein
LAGFGAFMPTTLSRRGLICATTRPPGAPRAVRTAASGTTTAALATGRAWTKVSLGTAVTAPRTRWFANATSPLVTFVMLTFVTFT